MAQPMTAAAGQVAARPAATGRAAVERAGAKRAAQDVPADVLVVGAGFAGLACARALLRAGRVPLLLDKGRRPGGRASWRTRPGPFAHGLPWIDAGAPAPEGWVPWDAAPPGARVPPEGLGPWIDALAGGLDVRPSVTATRIARGEDGWCVEAEGADGPAAFVARSLVLTVPPPQAVRLWPAAAAALADVRMAPCYALMAAFDAPTGLDPARAAPGDRAIPEHRRPGAEGADERWTFQLGPEASAEMLETERADAVAPLLARLGALADRPLPPAADARAHRWRYSHPVRALGAPVLEAEGVLLGGDWTTAAGRADAAAAALRSGAALAEALGAGGP